MTMSIRKRVALVAAISVAVLVLAVLGGIVAIQHEVKSRIVAALGPLGSAERIDVGLTTIELTGVRLRAPPGWPAPDTLRADHISLTPDRQDLLARRVHLRDVTVSGFEISLVRSASGTLQLLPNLRDSLASSANAASGASAASATGSAPAPLPPDKLVDHISLENGTFDFYDRTVSNPPYHVAVTDANATVDHVHLPALTEPTRVSVTGALKGRSQTGQVAFGGWIIVATKDSETHTTLHGVDITTLDPYLLKKAGAKAQVTGGTLDLDMTSTVRNNHLHAPGTVTLHHLQLAASNDPLDTFLSIPTRAAVAALKTHRGDITLHFVLEGNLRDPKFVLNDSLTTQLRAGFAQALGVSAQGVVEGAGQTAKGLADALKNLLSK